MYIIFQRYLLKFIISKLTKDLKNQYLIPARYNYVRDEEYEPWRFNPQWCVMPSIAFVKNKGPVIISWGYHKKGSILHMIHPCFQLLHILPSNYVDQLAPAVIKSRTIKPMKTSIYSTQFQMNEQRGTCNGIYSFILTDFHRFYLTSKLYAESEARSLMNCMDINDLLTQLTEENLIGEFIANSRL